MNHPHLDTPTALDQRAMNQRLQGDCPELYRKAFAGFPLTVFQSSWAVVLPVVWFTFGVPWFLVGLAVAAVLTVVLAFQLWQAPAAATALIRQAKRAYPGCGVEKHRGRLQFAEVA